MLSRTEEADLSYSFLEITAAYIVFYNRAISRRIQAPRITEGKVSFVNFIKSFSIRWQANFMVADKQESDLRTIYTLLSYC